MTASTYRPDIDGLRAIAVMAVVFFHAKLTFFGGGFVGVDIFFVISGFLITSILLHDFENGRFSIAKFYERRVRRILPALIFVLSIVTVVALFLYGPEKLEEFGHRILSVSLFAANVDYYLLLDYFGPNVDEQELLHTWSLAVEEQFYLFYPPFLFLLLSWAGMRALKWSMVGVGILSFALACYGVFHFRSATFYLSPTRAWELVVGCLLALRIPPPISHRAATVLATLGIGAILAAIAFFSVATPFPGASALLPCLGAGAVIYAGQYSQQTLVAKLLSTGPLVGIGLISYSLYLWHWPLLVMPEYYLDSPLTTAERYIAVLAAFAFASFSWKYVEQPFRKPHRTGKNVAKPIFVGLAALILFVALGACFILTKGLPIRVPQSVLLAEAAARDYEEVVNCIDPSDLSLIDHCPTSMNVFVWGDSHAAHYVPAIRAIFGKDAVGRFGGPGCPPVLGAVPVEVPSASETAVASIDPTVGPRCKRLNDAVINAITARDSVKLVVIGGAWQFFTEGNELSTGNGRYLVDSTDQISVSHSRALLTTGLKSIVDVLTKRGVQVLIMGDVAEDRTAPSECVAKSLMFGWPEVRCSIDAGPAMRRLAYSDQLIAAIGATPHVTDFITALQYCKGSVCAIHDGRNFVYRDEDHLTASAATALGPYIEEALALDGFRAISAKQ